MTNQFEHSDTLLRSLAGDRKKAGRRLPMPEQNEALQKRIRSVPLWKRGDLRTLSVAIRIPLATLYRYFRRGTLVRVTVRVKPLLTAEQRLARLRFALSHEFDSSGARFIDSMENYVHLDEKWFDLRKVKRRLYLTPSEAPPNDAAQHKHVIPKIMFLCAVARPRIDRIRNIWFHGKIGIWLFVDWWPRKEQVAIDRKTLWKSSQ